MAFLPTAALALLAASACNAALTVQRLDVAPSAAAASSIPVSEYYLPLTGKTTRKGAKTAARAALVQHLAAPNKTFVGPITGAGDDEEYTSAITIGGQSASTECFRMHIAVLTSGQNSRSCACLSDALVYVAECRLQC
jgi:hypothetical protein